MLLFFTFLATPRAVEPTQIDLELCLTLAFGGVFIIFRLHQVQYSWQQLALQQFLLVDHLYNVYDARV